MAQPVPLNLDLSTLWSDGNGLGPTRAGYTPLTRQNPRHADFLNEVTKKFNSDPQLVARFGSYQFIGDLPRGYTLWTHRSAGGSTIEECYGNAKGYFRSAVKFAEHVGELLDANYTKDRNMRNAVDIHNMNMAYVAIMNQNAYKATHNIPAPVLDPCDYGHALGLFVPRDANAEILADRQNNPIIAITCNCVLR